MKLFRLIVAIWFIIGFGLASAHVNAAESASNSLNTKLIEEIVGLKGVEKNGEYKFSVPQNDLSVTVDGFKITPPMGLTSWVDFAPSHDGAMIMGDIVLRETEIGSVEKAVIENGLSVTGMHNHFVRDQEKVMFMHIHGMGSTDRVAKSVRAVFDKVKDLRHGNPAEGQKVAVESSINTDRIESVLGQKGESNGGIFKVTIGRPDINLRDHGMEVTNFMGFNTWAAFQGTDKKAAVDGDFTMLENEVAPVIAALTRHGIEVVAVHNHMVDENPRIFFLHFWGVGSANDLSQGLKAALDETGKSNRTS
jgi:hypothetical protein